MSLSAPARPGRLWPVDKLILAYFAAASVLILVRWHAVALAPLLLAGHIVGAILLAFQIRYPNPTTLPFRHWYPVIYVALCYREAQIFVPAVNHWNADPFLARLDYGLWGANPTVWLERLYSPPVTEYLQMVYTLFVPAILFVALLLWITRGYREMRYYAFLISLGFLASYVGYLIVPARGPRFLLAGLQHHQLRGLWFFPNMQGALDRLESVAWDCFPSGHTELTILAWWSTRRFFPRLFWPYFAYTSSIIFATVYLRYHYTVDVLAGAAVAAILLGTAPWIYQKLDGKEA